MMSAFRSGPDGPSVTDLKRDLENNLHILRAIAETREGLEIRLVDYLAPYTLYAYDPGRENGSMELRLGSFHGQHEKRPTFLLQRDRDPNWFDYFSAQFLSVWEGADPAEI